MLISAASLATRRHYALTEEESDILYDQWTISSPARPLFQTAAAHLVLHIVGWLKAQGV